MNSQPQVSGYVAWTTIYLEDDLSNEQADEEEVDEQHGHTGHVGTARRTTQDCSTRPWHRPH